MAYTPKCDICSEIFEENHVELTNGLIIAKRVYSLCQAQICDSCRSAFNSLFSQHAKPECSCSK